MNNVAIAFLTKDRTDLSARTIEPLLQPGKFDLFWIDGSDSAADANFHRGYKTTSVFGNVRGGPDAAIVFALTKMLANREYTYVGLVENDVLLDRDWFDKTMALFRADSRLYVGAVSPRSYEDRALIQRDGYAVMHNLGAGCVIFKRDAAWCVLENYRTGFTLDNRAVFNQRSGIDIGAYWAFGGQSHYITADWHLDTALAAHGMCSLALTPAACTMIGQDPPLEQQGLKLVEFYAPRTNDADLAFERFCDTSRSITVNTEFHFQQGRWTIFPHQVRHLGGVFEGDWGLKWAQGYGPFAWQAREAGAALTFPLSGVGDVMVSGGKDGGKVEVVDAHSGYSCAPTLLPEGVSTAVMSLPLPCGVSYRPITLTALSPGVVFYGIRTGEPQVMVTAPHFDHAVLPPPI